MTVVFCGIVLVDTWADRSLSGHLSGEVIGLVSVFIWALTLLGSFELGPMGRLKVAMRR